MINNAKLRKNESMEPRIVHNRWVGVYLIISLAAVLWLFQKFLFPALIAALLVLICNGITNKLETLLSRYKILKNWVVLITAALVTLLLIVLIVLPLLTLISYVINKVNLQDLMNFKNQLINWFTQVTWISVSIKQKIISETHSFINSISSHNKPTLLILTSMQKLSSSTVLIAMMIVLFFLFLWKRRQIAEFLAALTPLQPEVLNRITVEVSSTLQITFFSLLILAIAQGLAFAALMLFFDYNAPVLGFAAGICSMVPIFGTALVWVPIAISEFATGHIIGCVVIVLYSWIVMAILIDNFLRIILLKKVAKSLQHENPINEFLLFFAITAGLSVVGFWGIILGPAVLSLFLALSYIYIDSKKRVDKPLKDKT